MANTIDCVIVGSGPNGLSAANLLVDAGLRVHVLEAKETLGGGLRTEELTLPGFQHDRCSAIHPMAILSPYFQTLNLDTYGLKWRSTNTSFGQTLDGEKGGVALVKSLEETAEALGQDGEAYCRLIRPFLSQGRSLLADLMAPLGIPKHPFLMARFGWTGLQPASRVVRRHFRGEAAKALFGGCAAHSILPLDWMGTGALGLIFALTGHLETWPVAEGGSHALARALSERFQSKGGTVETGRFVRSMSDLPSHRFVLFDTSPDQLASIAGDTLPDRYRKRLMSYIYGPGAFKVDWALSEPIPWRAPSLRKASTVHVSGNFEEMAAGEAAIWRGEHPERPFVLVGQQSILDPGRAPTGQHTGYAYIHVPSGSTEDMTEIIEDQIERFAPGFKDTILGRFTMNTKDFHAHNPNYIGGAITGGAARIDQLFTRPVARINPYTTPNPSLLLCSASTPPGGGVHGMCGYYAARTVLRKLRLPVAPVFRGDYTALPAHS